MTKIPLPHWKKRKEAVFFILDFGAKVDRGEFASSEEVGMEAIRLLARIMDVFGIEVEERV